MSYDIFVQDFPPEAKSPEEIPPDFRTASLGKRAKIIERIQQLIATADFSDPAWGRIEGDGWSIEMNMGATEECSSFAFHVRGGEQAIEVVAAILRTLNLRAIDPQAGSFFTRPRSHESFEKWLAFRNRSCRQTE